MPSSAEQQKETSPAARARPAVKSTSAVWQRIISTLQERIKPHNFDMWLRPIECLAEEKDHLQLSAPNRYIREWFENNYLPIVLQELQNNTGIEYKVSFAESVSDEAPAEPVEPAEVVAKPSSIRDCDLNDRYQFEAFVVGPSNALAHAAAHAVAKIPASKYNPLFIYGGVGLGKTHLLSAIGHEIRRNQPTFRMLYRSCESFINDYIEHVRVNRMEEFRRTYRERCDVLLIDDIQFLAGKASTQDEFFHTFNALYDLNRQIVVTSDKYPHEIPDLEERLRTRFQWGLIADIQQPELETRVAILMKKAEAEKISVRDDVYLYLATHIKSNVRELEGSLIRLAAIASLRKKDITVELAQEALKEFLSQSNPTVTIETIQKEVCAFFNIKISDLKGQKRHKAIARPRQIAMYLSRKLTGCSFPEIGQRFGGKDHSTVISACKKIADLVDKDLSIRTTVETIERQLQL